MGYCLTLINHVVLGFRKVGNLLHDRLACQLTLQVEEKGMGKGATDDILVAVDLGVSTDIARRGVISRVTTYIPLLWIFYSVSLRSHVILTINSDIIHLHCNRE